MKQVMNFMKGLASFGCYLSLALCRKITMWRGCLLEEGGLHLLPDISPSFALSLQGREVL